MEKCLSGALPEMARQQTATGAWEGQPQLGIVTWHTRHLTASGCLPPNQPPAISCITHLAVPRSIVVVQHHEQQVEAGQQRVRKADVAGDGDGAVIVACMGG